MNPDYLPRDAEPIPTLPNREVGPLKPNLDIPTNLNPVPPVVLPPDPPHPPDLPVLSSPFTPNTRNFHDPDDANHTIRDIADTYGDLDDDDFDYEIQIVISTPLNNRQLAPGAPPVPAFGNRNGRQLMWARARRIMNALIRMGVPRSAFKDENWFRIRPNQFDDNDGDGNYDSGVDTPNTDADIRIVPVLH